LLFKLPLLLAQTLALLRRVAGALLHLYCLETIRQPLAK
jgi:hypothetical protein